MPPKRKVVADDDDAPAPAPAASAKKVAEAASSEETAATPAPVPAAPKKYGGTETITAAAEPEAAGAAAGTSAAPSGDAAAAAQPQQQQQQQQQYSWTPPDYDAITSLDDFSAMLPAPASTSSNKYPSFRDAQEARRVYLQAKRAEATEAVEPYLDGEKGGYSYREMLLQFYSTRGDAVVHNYPIPAVVAEAEGTTKTVFSNVRDTVLACHPELLSHAPDSEIRKKIDALKSFLNGAMNVVCSLDAREQIILQQGRVSPIIIQQRIDEYIEQRVRCYSCNSFHTIHEKRDRDFFLVCQACKGERTISLKQAYKEKTGLSNRKKRQLAGL